MKALFLALFVALAGVADARAGWDPDEDKKAAEAVAWFRQNDPSLGRFFSQAYGYVVFPDVYKGGFLMLGGGHGRGYVFDHGRLVGRSSITQLNVGPQLGGQSFSEIIFFKDAAAFNDFKKGNFEISAQMTAIVVTTGIATNADYSDGVAIFILPKAGVMADATIGGQKFSFEPTSPAGGSAAPVQPLNEPLPPVTDPYAAPAPAGSSSAFPAYDPTPLEGGSAY